MPTLAIIADTHIPSRASEIPAWVEAHVRAADHLVHAGDFDSPEAYDRVEELADGDLTAVSGNVDPGSLDLSETAILEYEGHTFVVTHGTGSPRGYEDRVRETARAATDDPAPVAISGHTHKVLDSGAGESIRILNPGSATGAWPASETTMMVADVSEGEIDVTVRRD